MNRILVIPFAEVFKENFNCGIEWEAELKIECKNSFSVNHYNAWANTDILLLFFFGKLIFHSLDGAVC